MAVDDSATKLCSKCGNSKNISEFHKDVGKKDGLAAQCKVCAKKRATDWYNDNPERAKITRQQWHQKNRDEVLKRNREYWRETNQERLATSRAYRNSHREQKAASDKAWQAANPEKLLIYRRVSEARRRSRKTASPEHHSADDIMQLYRKQRAKCACCKGPIKNGYHVDHVIPLSKGGHNGRLNIQLLCPSCNSRKHAKDPIIFMQENGFLI